MLHSATALLEAWAAAMRSKVTWIVTMIVRILGGKVAFDRVLFIVHVRVLLGVPDDRSD